MTYILPLKNISEKRTEKSFRACLTHADECHHAASDTISNVLKEVKAKYVHGVTATPKRGDGPEIINYTLIGPIRHSYTAKEKAKSQGIEHMVYPWFTPVVAPRGIIKEKMHPNEACE